MKSTTIKGVALSTLCLITLESYGSYVARFARNAHQQRSTNKQYNKPAINSREYATNANREYPLVGPSHEIVQEWYNAQYGRREQINKTINGEKTRFLQQFGRKPTRLETKELYKQEGLSPADISQLDAVRITGYMNGEQHTVYQFTGKGLCLMNQFKRNYHYGYNPRPEYIAYEQKKEKIVNSLKLVKVPAILKKDSPILFPLDYVIAQENREEAYRDMFKKMMNLGGFELNPQTTAAKITDRFNVFARYLAGKTIFVDLDLMTGTPMIYIQGDIGMRSNAKRFNKVLKELYTTKVPVKGWFKTYPTSFADIQPGLNFDINASMEILALDPIVLNYVVTKQAEQIKAMIATKRSMNPDAEQLKTIDYLESCVNQLTQRHSDHRKHIENTYVDDLKKYDAQLFANLEKYVATNYQDAELKSLHEDIKTGLVEQSYTPQEETQVREYLNNIQAIYDKQHREEQWLRDRIAHQEQRIGTYDDLEYVFEQEFEKKPTRKEEKQLYMQAGLAPWMPMIASTLKENNTEDFD